MDKIARDVFGDGARIKQGQVTKFHDAAFHLLDQAGWQPGGAATAMRARSILREQASILAPMVELKGAA
jgi:hypothetical protein